ncbi:MAG: beta-ketoacyl synthase N-terminal-like domain-containing protein, partial [Candidatus Limnocylindrus sp.]
MPQREPLLEISERRRAEHRLFTREHVWLEGTSVVLADGVSCRQSVRCATACSQDTITEVPTARWEAHALGMLPETVMSRVRHGGFVWGAELADHGAFSISRAEAAAMDPCQRLLLEHSYGCLHECALDRIVGQANLTGVFVGFSGSEFAPLLMASPAGGSVYAATGAVSSVASGRISYALSLHGPCASYDTACSSGLVACHAGMRAVQLDEAAIGLVSAAGLILTPMIGTCFAIAGMTSVLGRSHTFDARADGYARSEACGAVVLRGAAALCALSMCGSAVRQDGRSASLTAPNGQAQRDLLRSTMGDARVSADEVMLVEAHGTGTALGDPIEIRSVAGVLVAPRKGELTLGGIKANVGHAEAAAGLMGLIKLGGAGIGVMEAAANAQLRALNPHVSGALGGGACALPVQRCGLGLTASRRNGGVSSFGFSGTIAHAVVMMKQVSREEGVPRVRGSLWLRRVELAWRRPPHPLAQQRLPSGSASAAVVRSPTRGALLDLMAGHVVGGRLIFPAAGYLEMARAAVCAC